MKTTIADVAVAILVQTNNEAVMNGDCGLLDQIALEADKRLGTKLCSEEYVSPTYRHQRVLNALESKRGKQLFTKVYDKHTRERVFRLKENE